MWIKLHESMFSGQNPIFSSGGLDKDIIAFGGVTLVAGGSFLKLSFKRVGNQKWKAKANVTGLSNQWMHIAGTWALEGSVTLYIDGTLMETNGQSTTSGNTGAMKDSTTVGKMTTSNGDDKFGQFVIDEWYFWDWELSRNQVSLVYTAYETGT